jgi:Transposase and inactivated derivatives
MNERTRRKQSYPSDLTDTQWAEILPEYSGLREYTWPKRELMDAVLYLVKTGCQWRSLPHDFPPHPTVHSFYRRARISGLWDRILRRLAAGARESAGRKPGPTYALVDSQSVKTVSASKERGIDGGKKNKGAQAAHCR